MKLAKIKHISSIYLLEKNNWWVRMEQYLSRSDLNSSHLPVPIPELIFLYETFI